MVSPRLVLQVLDNEDEDFGPGPSRCLVMDAHKIGWAQWSRFPPSAFFTLRKGSPHNAVIVPGLSHLRIYFMDDATGYGVLVFDGRIGDPDRTRDDVVWRAHGYLAELALSRTGYRIMYSGRKVSNAIWREYMRDKRKGKYRDYGAAKQEKGIMRHVPLGTLETPTNDAGQKIKLDAGFGVIDTPRLLFFYDLSEIARANTRNNVTFEVSRDEDPEFNFWKDKGSILTGLTLRLPGNIRQYRYVPGVSDVRNDVASLGTKRGQAREIKADVEGGTYGWAEFGRRQDTVAIRTLAGIKHRDTDAGKFSAQKLVVQRAAKEASKPTRELMLDVPYDRLRPFQGWDIEDIIPVTIMDDDLELEDEPYRIVGAQGIMDENGYRQALFVLREPESPTCPTSLGTKITKDTGTTVTFALPPGADVTGRTLMVLLVWDNVATEAATPLVAAGWTAIGSSAASSPIRGQWFAWELDGTEGYDGEGDEVTFTWPGGASAHMIAFVDLLASNVAPGPETVLAYSTASADPGSLSWASLDAVWDDGDKVRTYAWMTTGGGSIKGDPKKFKNIGAARIAGEIALRISRRFVTLDEPFGINPSTYTCPAPKLGGVLAIGGTCA